MQGQVQVRQGPIIRAAKSSRSLRQSQAVRARAGLLESVSVGAQRVGLRVHSRGRTYTQLSRTSDTTTRATANDSASSTSVEESAKITPETVLQAALESGAIGDTIPLAMFMDLKMLRKHFTDIHDATSPSNPDACFLPKGGCKHAYAVKANPMVAVLKEAVACGMALECASAAEVALAQHAGAAPEDIILDSPAKSLPDLQAALQAGLYVNIDNFEEVARIAALREADPGCKAATVGMRINPLRIDGSIGMTSTATSDSKFGVALTAANRRTIIDLFAVHPWLRMLHCHVGSQGMELAQLVVGAKAIADLADEINEVRPGQVEVIDIGGGVSNNYEGDEVPSFSEYFGLLARDAPNLLEYRIFTEFGRRVVTKPCWTAAKVEYTKEGGHGRPFAMCGAGAQLFCRAAMLPHLWAHRITVHDSTGRARDTSDLVNQDIAGPLCFSGDIIAKDRPLPLMQAGDWIVVHDAGGYCIGHWMLHTSQCMPPVYGFVPENPSDLTIMKKAQTPEDLVQYWL